MSIHIDIEKPCDRGEYLEQQQEYYLRQAIGDELYEWLDHAIERQNQTIGVETVNGKAPYE